MYSPPQVFSEGQRYAYRPTEQMIAHDSSHALGVHTPTTHSAAISPSFRSIGFSEWPTLEWPLNCFVSTIWQVIWPSPGTLNGREMRPFQTFRIKSGLSSELGNVNTWRSTTPLGPQGSAQDNENLPRACLRGKPIERNGVFLRFERRT